MRDEEEITVAEVTDAGLRVTRFSCCVHSRRTVMQRLMRAEEIVEAVHPDVIVWPSKGPAGPGQVTLACPSAPEEVDGKPLSLARLLALCCQARQEAEAAAPQLPRAEETVPIEREEVVPDPEPPEAVALIVEAPPDPAKGKRGSAPGEDAERLARLLAKRARRTPSRPIGR